jgi:hypothetical protein
MTIQSVPPNAYSDVSDQHPNMILGSLQLLFWLFFRPTAWKNHIARIDPELRPNFFLAELNEVQWYNPALNRFLLQIYLIPSILMGLLIGLSSKRLEITFDIVAYGMTFGIVSGISTSVVGGAAGLVANGLVSSVAYFVTGDSGFSLVYGIAGSSAVSIAGSTIASMSGDNRKKNYSLVRQINGIAIGIVIGVFGIFLAWFVALGLVTAAPMMLGQKSLTLGNDLMTQVIYSVVYGLTVGVAVIWMTDLRKQKWQPQKWLKQKWQPQKWLKQKWQPQKWQPQKWGNTLSVGLSVSVGVAVAGVVLNGEMLRLGIKESVLKLDLPTSVALGMVGNLVSGILSGSFAAVFFGFSYTIAEKIANPWAAAVSGALATSSVSFFFARELVVNNVYAAYIEWKLIFIVGGLALFWWRPILSYPLTAILNIILYRLDEQRISHNVTFLRYHSAFWDEHQRIPLMGLDDHIVLVSERNLAEAKTAINYLCTSHQRWAAEAAQIELDARRLENSTDVIAIGQAHRSFEVGNFKGSTSNLFRTFNRISENVETALNQSSIYNQRLVLNAVADHLDGLLRELTRNHDKYAIRFSLIAQRWSKIIAFQLEELARLSELRQEIDSPYIIGIPLSKRQEIFVGRTDISARIEQLLINRHSPPLLLYGQRRSGKTSLLNNLGRLLPNSVIPLFVDLQGPASNASDHAGFLYNLAKGMIDSAKRQSKLHFPPLPREALADDPFTSFDDWLNDVEIALQDNAALLALDEFEVLDQVLVEGRFSETAILGMFRNLIQHRPQFKVLFSGSHTLEDFQHWSSYLINAQVLHLGHLKESEARKLIEHPTPTFTLRYQPEASQRVLTLTQGHPFLVQLLCAEIVALKNEQDPSIKRLATLDDIEAAIPEALSSGSMFFSDIEGNQVDGFSRKVLRFIASQGEGIVVNLSVLISQFPERLEESLSLLLRRELIETTSEGYRFQIELIRRWFVK